jgi:hypothetical protein
MSPSRGYQRQTPASPERGGTRRERDVNWGDRSRLDGRAGSSQTLAWVSLDEPSPMTVYAAAGVRRGSPLCILTIEWGHGGASVAADYPLLKRLRVPLAASMIKVWGRLISPSGGAAAPTDEVDVSTFIARGVDGEVLRNTRWIHRTGAAGTLAEGPQRLMRVEGYNAGAATFVHLFDGAPAAGAEPALLIPAPAGRRFVARRFDSQGFLRSVTWGASSSALTYSPDPAAVVRLDAELLL